MRLAELEAYRIGIEESDAPATLVLDAVPGSVRAATVLALKTLNGATSAQILTSLSSLPAEFDVTRSEGVELGRRLRAVGASC